jgi:glycolate oxidase FAD binding subunit
VSVAALDAISEFNPADLVVSVGAGIPLDRLAAQLAAHGAWLALDPPGPPSRTVGGILAAGGAGPLSARYGPARDQVLGLTVVAGDDTVLRLGGRVVKNVAGFDLAKLVVGSYGAFGVIAEAHLRLRALPRADRTAVWTGTAATVARIAAAALAAGAAPGALEVVAPPLAEALGWAAGAEWALAARALGAGAAVDEELEAIASAAAVPAALGRDGDEAWAGWRLAVGRWPVVLRLGAEPARWPDAVALAERHLGTLLGASVTVPRGTVRVGVPRCTSETVQALRGEAARHQWPVTVERADAATRAAVGIWGALPPAVADLARALEDRFDPAHALAVPLGL